MSNQCPGAVPPPPRLHPYRTVSYVAILAKQGRGHSSILVHPFIIRNELPELVLHATVHVCAMGIRLIFNYVIAWKYHFLLGSSFPRLLSTRPPPQNDQVNDDVHGRRHCRRRSRRLRCVL